MKRTTVPASVHLVAMADLKGVIAKHPQLSAMELLALASQMVGNLIALQDQTKVTPDMAMLVVRENIEIGNATAIQTLLGKTDGTA